MTLQTLAYIVCGAAALVVLTPVLFLPHWRAWRLHREVTRRPGYLFPPGEKLP